MIFIFLGAKNCGKKLRVHLTQPPSPYVDKREHFANPPPPLSGYVVCEWPLRKITYGEFSEFV